LLESPGAGGLAIYREINKSMGTQLSLLGFSPGRDLDAGDRTL